MQQQDEVYEVLDAGVRALAARQRVGVDLLGELLLTRERRAVSRRDAGEGEKILAGEPLGRCRDDVTDAHIEMEGGEGAVVEPRLDGVAGTTVGCGVEVGHRCANAKDETVLQIALGGILEPLADKCALCQRRLSDIGAEAVWGGDGLVDIFGGPGGMRIEAQLEGVATLEEPRRIWLGEEAREEAVERDLTAQTHQICVLRAGKLLEALFKPGAEGTRGLIAADHYSHLCPLVGDLDSRSKPVMGPR